jgi:ribonuclease Z
MDHILALPAYICRRRMMKMEPPTIFLPAHAVALVQKLLEVYKHLDRGRLPCRLIGVLPNEEYELSRENVLTTVETFHSIRSVGYIVWERRKRLKPELQHLTQEQIRQLAVSGQEVSAEIRFPRVAYLGDSTIQGLDANPAMFDADILIMEMSFVAKCHRGDKLRRYGHVHLDDVITRQDKFRNKVIIASHFSTRCPDRVIKHIVAKRLPDMLDGRLILWF